MHYYKTERHYATYHFTDTRLKQDTENVNNPKKFIFKKLHFQILGQNSKKTEIYLSKIFSCLKGLSKALEIYQNTIVSLEYYPKYLGPANRLQDTMGGYMKIIEKTNKKGYPIVMVKANLDKQEA
ncbi:hypothetical protein HNR35_001079 [Borreliella spielmanii]|uniref:Uncharacterized protein n=1 Tax=Borreliella spielmanii TaxID=88916 RepID=A0ABR6P7R8_9SPIR|nr:hypothetical protein [Borreliella spielmanii]MBB6032076.1 hypothetical protein [Borreliella spielmanii]